MTQANDERAARKEYIRRRQKTVFTVIAVILTIALVVSCLISFRVIDVEPQAKSVVQPNYGQAVPCAAKNQDGTAMKWRFSTEAQAIFEECLEMVEHYYRWANADRTV